MVVDEQHHIDSRTEILTDDIRYLIYRGPVRRLDKTLSEIWNDLSRVRWQALIKTGQIQVNQRVESNPSRKIVPGSSLHAFIPAPVPSKPRPEDIPLHILYEDEHLIVINKAAGMVVHPGAGNQNGTLVNALLYHCRGTLSGIGGEIRPGIVHRLDKDTSGVMVAAKTDQAHAGLSEQFAEHSLIRVYTALVWGHPVPASGRVEGNIGRHPIYRQRMAVLERGGKYAVSHYKTLKTYQPEQLPPASKIQCELETGRTHQIRVHMTNIGHPLIGDPIYTMKKYDEKLLKIVKGLTTGLCND